MGCKLCIGHGKHSGVAYMRSWFLFCCSVDNFREPSWIAFQKTFKMPHLKFHVCKLEVRCVCWFSISLVNKRFHLEPNWTNQRFWPDSRQILCHHYGIFCRWVAEVPPCETSLCSSKEWGNMAVFTSYTEKNSSEMPGVCLGVDGQFWNWLALSKLISPPLSDIVRLPFQGGKLLSLALF